MANLGNNEAKVSPKGSKTKKQRRKPAPPAQLKLDVEALESQGELPPGFQLVRKTYTEVHRDGTSTEVGHDLVLACSFDGRTWYCGRTANWKSKESLVFDPFQDVITSKTRVTAADHATASAWGIYRQWEKDAAEANSEVEISADEIIIHRAINLEKRPRTAIQVQWRTTLEETQKLDAIRQALQQLGATVNGKPVTSYVDVVRYVFDIIGK